MLDNTIHRTFAYIDQHFEDHLAATQRYLRQPSISGENLGIQECAAMTAEILRALGAEVRLVPLKGGHPVVYGRINSSKATRTLLVYGMYDVQPVEPLAGWDTPPFGANIVNGRIVARGALNSKGPLMAFLNAVQSIQATAGEAPVNMIFIIEGEEEQGSRHLPQFIKENADELKMSEAAYYHFPMEGVKGYPQVGLGFKGIAYFEMTVKTLETNAHSMVAPIVDNPAWRLVWALASMRAADGHITIDEFYDNARPPSASEEELFPGLIDVWGAGAIRDMYGVTRVRAGLSGVDVVREALFAPTLNIDGFLSGYTGPGSNAIVPATAMCKMDIRLVPDMTIPEMMGKVRAHLDRRGFEDIDVRFVTGYGPARTPSNTHIADAAIKSLRWCGVEPKVVPMMPCTGPQAMFSGPPLNLPFVMSALGHGWLLHAPNEYIEVEGLRQCEKSAAAFLYEFAEP